MLVELGSDDVRLPSSASPSPMLVLSLQVWLLRGFGCPVVALLCLPLALLSAPSLRVWLLCAGLGFGALMGSLSVGWAGMRLCLLGFVRLRVLALPWCAGRALLTLRLCVLALPWSVGRALLTFPYLPLACLRALFVRLRVPAPCWALLASRPLNHAQISQWLGLSCGPAKIQDVASALRFAASHGAVPAKPSEQAALPQLLRALGRE